METIKDVKLYISIGMFQKANQTLKRNSAKISNTDLKEVLDYCTETCAKESMRDNIKTAEVLDFLSTIEFFNFEYKYKFLEAYQRFLYYIVLLLIKKNDVNNIIKLKPYLCSRSIKACKETKVKDTHKAITSKLYNYMVDHYSMCCKDVKLLILLSELVAELLSYIKSVNEILESYIPAFFKLYFQVESDISKCLHTDIYRILLLQVNVDDELLESLVQSFIHVLSNSVMQGKVKDMLCLLNILSSETKRFSGKDVKLIVQILKKFSKILCDFKENLDETELSSALNICRVQLQKLTNKKIAKLLALVLINQNVCFKEVDQNLWNTKVTDLLENALLSFLDELQSIMEKSSFETLKYDIPTVYNLGLLKLTILKKSNKKNKRPLVAANKMVKCVEDLKDCNWKNWAIYWKQFGTTLYNLGVQVFVENSTVSIEYFILFMKCYQKIDDQRSIIDEDLFLKALQCMCKYYLEVQDYKNVLIYSAIGTVLFMNKTKTLFEFWIRAKYKSEEKELQQLTLIKCINEYNDVLKIPSLSKKDQIKLMNLELNSYKTHWPSKVPMISLCKELVLVDQTPNFAKTLIVNFIDSIPANNKEFYFLISEATQKLEPQYNVYAALLKYMAYIYLLNEASNRILNEMEKNKDLLTPEDAVIASEKDEKHILYVYNDLKLENHFKVMNYLLEFLNYFKNMVPFNLSDELIQLFKDLNVCNILINGAFEFRLQMYTIEMLQCWYLCLELSKIFKDDLTMLICISFILESANVDSEDVNELMSQADAVIKKLEQKPVTFHIITVYYVNITLYYLTVYNLDKAMECFELVKKYTQKANNEMLNNQLEYLKAKFMMLPCSYYNFQHEYESVPAKYFCFIKYLSSYTRENNDIFFDHLYKTCLVQEVTTDLCELYGSLKLPREQHCYGKMIGIRAMGKVLPLRTAYTLFHLIYADVLSEKLDDCQCKLKNISDILGDEQTASLELLCDNFKGISLECTGTASEYQPSCSSPTFKKENLRLPQCIRHSLSCDCFFCTSYEYQELVLLQFYSEGLHRTYRNEYTIGNRCFTEVFRMFDHFISKKDQWQMKVYEKIPLNILKYRNDKLDIIYCKALMEYRNNYIRQNLLEEARAPNQKLLMHIEKIKHLDYYLYDAIHVFQPTFSDAVNLNKENFSDSEPEIGEAKTPENCISKIVLKTPKTNLELTPKTRFVKPIKLDLGNENQQTLSVPQIYVQKPSTTKKQKSSQNEFNILEETVDFIPSTPPSKKAPNEGVKFAKPVDPSIRRNLFLENETSAKKKDVKSARKNTKLPEKRSVRNYRT